MWQCIGQEENGCSELIQGQQGLGDIGFAVAATWKEVGGLHVQGYPGELREILSQK